MSKICLSQLNSDLAVGFEERMCRDLVICAQSCSERNFSHAAQILSELKLNYEGLFDSEFKSAESLKTVFDEIEKGYNNGTYDEKDTVDKYVKAFFLGKFCYEYLSLLQKLRHACILMQRLDLGFSENYKFFERSSGKLILKEQFVGKKNIVPFSKKCLNDTDSNLPYDFELNLLPPMVDCANQAFNNNFSKAAEILSRLKMDCKGFLVVGINFRDLKKNYDDGIAGRASVRNFLLREFYNVQNLMLEKLAHACIAMQRIDMQSPENTYFGCYMGRLVLKERFIVEDIVPITGYETD